MYKQFLIYSEVMCNLLSEKGEVIFEAVGQN